MFEHSGECVSDKYVIVPNPTCIWFYFTRNWMLSKGIPEVLFDVLKSLSIIYAHHKNRFAKFKVVDI